MTVGTQSVIGVVLAIIAMVVGVVTNAVSSLNLSVPVSTALVIVGGVILGLERILTNQANDPPVPPVVVNVQPAVNPAAGVQYPT